MLSVLLVLFSILLLAFGFFLIFRQPIFFSLIKESARNQTFLRTYGILFLVLGLVAFGLTFTDHRTILTLWISLILFISATFSVQFSSKMK